MKVLVMSPVFCTVIFSVFKSQEQILISFLPAKALKSSCRALAEQENSTIKAKNITI
jgi:hypothetical protein